MATWAVIQHVPFEGPGLITEVAADKGYQVDVHRMDLGHALPTVRELDGLVVLGGPMSAHDDDEYPSLADERRLLAEAATCGLPVLGVCLGAQLLAAALGAEVYSGAGPEIGLGTATLTPAGERDPVLGPAGPVLPVLHWHADTFTLPPGAVHLARTDLFSQQAYRFGELAYGLQFHVEVNGQFLDAIAGHLPAGHRLDRHQAIDVERAGRAVLSRFFDRAQRQGANSRTEGTARRHE